MRMRAAVYALLAPAAVAVAQPALPAGWTLQTNNGAMVVSSTGADANSRLALTVLPVAQGQVLSTPWFESQTMYLAQRMGTPAGATAVQQQNGILIRAVKVRNATGSIYTTVYYAYPVAHGSAMTVVIIPPTVRNDDPRLVAADAWVQQLAVSRFELAAPAAAMAAPKGDIDLTYHAKAIPPKDRDVPIKATYLFVGMAFGAEYGGVGTSMNWGQHQVSQVLLLFANGVAAKVDLRGGNLAGKYQAEGFASMDVADPSAVSGAPYGHWTEDANAIHVTWNVGAPSELTKSGNELHAKNERWTPYTIADGQHLEGTFVRKMEAGLKSQVGVFHEDGTFQGDGLNVTMGGEIVNPQFPAQGSGRYEIRKGSMILYFANGYTIAIACILDPPTGSTRTVLLNGFPFERVR